MNPADFEKLGALYLGRPVSAVTTDGATSVSPTKTGASVDEPVLLPSKHLVTHGVIVGMTGSGKTGLAVDLLEECAIDGIPAIAIDPKGDLGNLMLAFPQLDAASFAPWVSATESAEEVAARHARGLADWGQDGARVERFVRGAERVLYTPGSSAGRPLSLMPSLDAPPEGTDTEVVRDRALSTARALLTLVGVDPDPVKNPENTLVATILLEAWSRGSSFDPVSLIRAIQSPPFARLGAMDLDSVVPPSARAGLAAKLNNAFASPAMAGFFEGEPLDVQRLFYTSEGKPKLSILSIAHLSDDDRMFFVTSLLGEVIAWMRQQPGTTSLRAVLYMDEVFGYFPPVAAPPAKQPMLTLLKQARAFGLGVVLATQNPVDLDYKGLSNTGTWMLGRLQTERDKLRVLDGLEGAASASGRGLDRVAMDALLSGLPPRTFLLHSVHEAGPRLFQTRWALSYLRGPLAREEMRRLAQSTSTPPHRPSTPAIEVRGSRAPAQLAPAPEARPQTTRPVLPTGVTERFLVRPDIPSPRAYRAGVLCRASVHYVDAKSSIDAWLTPSLLAPIGDEGPRWADAWVLGMSEPALASEPIDGVEFEAAPAAALRPASYKAWEKSALAHLHRDRPLVLASASELSLVARLGETREAFEQRVGLAVRERRDLELEKLAGTWQPKIDKARDRVAKAERKLEQASSVSTTTLVTNGIEVGATVLGALFGGRRRSVTAGAARAARSAARHGANREAAEAELEAARETLASLETNVRSALETIRNDWQPQNVAIAEKSIAAKKTDLRIERLVLTWVPVA